MAAAASNVMLPFKEGGNDALAALSGARRGMFCFEYAL